MAHSGDVEPEPLLAAGRAAGVPLWWPLLSVLYLLVVPSWEPIGVAALGCGLTIAALLRAACRSGPGDLRRRR
ncbi:MAG: hypothetical protein M3Z25_09475 [Actinomycetota bacterium]|nr:hypothetical protein [Actinomycetota bacterium]